MSSPIEELVDSVKARLPLGPAAGPLLQGLLGLLFSQPNGLKGFLDKLNAAGLGAQASSWIGKADSQPLSAQGAMHAFGGEAITTLANKVGVDPGVATAAIAYLTPKIIGLLTAGGVVPTTAPAAVAAFLGSSSSAGGGATAGTRPIPRVVEEPAPAARGAEVAGLRRWIFPLIVILLALAFLAHFWGEKHEPAPPPPAAPAQHY